MRFIKQMQRAIQSSSTTIIDKFKNKVKGKGGYSIAEALMCVLILLLVTEAMTGGIRFAMTQYGRSMELSQARILTSTLENKISANLQAATITTTTGGEIYPKLKAMDRENTADASATEFGYIAFVSSGDIGDGTESTPVPLLPRSAYTYDLEAKAEITHYPETDGMYYTVKINIQNRDGKELSDTIFDVLVYN